MSLTASRDSLLRAILELLWAQWTELGVAGTKGSPATIIDPEGLLASTCVFGRYDPRLFDEVLDWLSLHSGVLDVTRLRRVGAPVGAKSERLLGTLVDFMRERGSAQKWAGAAAQALAREERVSYGSQSLFRLADGKELPTFGEPDQFFATHGYVRPRLELRGMSVAPDPRRPALARLRMRALVGQGFRAEVLLYLSTHDHAHGRHIAERAAFSQRQVAEYLSALSAAGFAEVWDEGRTRQYRLAMQFGEVGADSAAYVDWLGAFGVIRELWETVSAAATEGDSYSVSVRLRAGLERVRRVLPVEGLGLSGPEVERYPGERLVDYAIEWIEVAGRRILELAAAP
jgi:hypothetical protein